MRRKLAVRKDKKNGIFLKVEKLGMYECEVWKKATGGSTTYRWIEDDGTFPITRQTLVVSNRPQLMQETVRGNRSFIRTKHGRLHLEEFMSITPLKIEGRTFTGGAADSAFGGTLLDLSVYHETDGYVYVGRVWS
jgi:hypothetical protein